MFNALHKVQIFKERDADFSASSFKYITIGDKLFKYLIYIKKIILK